jgi:hypothetical protein
MPPGIQIETVTSADSEVRFDSRGLANGSNILIKNSQGESKTIAVNIVGTASIQ